MAANYEQDLVQVTCASGKQASHLIPRLCGKWKRLRLACNPPASVHRLRKQYPDAEDMKIDLAEPASCHSILHGVTIVFHSRPLYHLHESEIGYNIVDAAVVESQGPKQ